MFLPKVDDAGTAETTQLHPTYTYGYDAAGNQLTDVDPYGRVTSFGYNAQGRRTSRTLPGGEVELWRYDSRGRAEWHRDFNGVWEQSIFDDDGVVAAGRLQETRRFAGPAGKAAPSSAPPTDLSSYVESITLHYDALGRQDVTQDWQKVNGSLPGATAEAS